MFIKMIFQREKHVPPPPHTPAMFHSFLSTMNAFPTTCFFILIICYVDVVYHVWSKGVNT